MSSVPDRASTSAELRADRARGALLGIALGDAMGMPGELWTRRRLRGHFGWIDRFLPGPAGHFIVDGFQAGQVTDDTQQTMMLADAIIDGAGDVDAHCVARHLVAWADRIGASEGNFLGPTSAAAIEALRQGADPATTGTPPEGSGSGQTNGAAMRIAPVGIVRSPGDLQALVDAVEASCLMSHHTSIAISAAAMVAGVVSAGIESAANRNGLDGALEVGFAAAELGADRGLEVIAPSVVDRTRLALDVARRQGDDEEFLDALYAEVGASVAAIETVPAAIGLLTRSACDPLRCATLAANLGGDTDTIGAIATGMAGALRGASAVPQRVVAVLNEVNGLPLEVTADTLLTLRR